MNLQTLRPIRKDMVFDLVEEAGFDTTDWINSARRCAVKANPKYCYEWSFVQPGKVAILNLWWDMLEEDADGSIVHSHNFRTDAAGNAGKPTWVRRATSLDQAVEEVRRKGLQLRVVINDGIKRKRGDSTSKPSKVLARQLDSRPWHVAHYDPTTGDHVLRRS